MLLNYVDQISRWLAATDIAVLTLQGPDGHVRLTNGPAGVVRSHDAMPADAADGLTIVSPSVGVFLHRHPMHAAPLAPPGAHVRPGDTLALLQIGVLLVPVLAPRAGIVAGTWTAHGSVVGFGARLIQLHTLPGISAP